MAGLNFQAKVKACNPFQPVRKASSLPITTGPAAFPPGVRPPTLHQDGAFAWPRIFQIHIPALRLSRSRLEVTFCFSGPQSYHLSSGDSSGSLG